MGFVDQHNEAVKKLGEALCVIRRHGELTIPEAAVKANLPEMTVGRIEDGGLVSQVEVARYYRSLGVSSRAEALVKAERIIGEFSDLSKKTASTEIHYPPTTEIVLILRKANGLSQEVLANRADSKQPAVSLYERGNPSALLKGTLFKLAVALGYTGPEKPFEECFHELYDQHLAKQHKPKNR